MPIGDSFPTKELLQELGSPWGGTGLPRAVTPNHAHFSLRDRPSTSTVAFLERVPRDGEVQAAEKGLEPWHRLPRSPDPPQQSSRWARHRRTTGMEPLLAHGAGMHRDTLRLQQERC